MMAGMRIASCRVEFAVPDDVAYFNTASLGPLLHVVRDAGEEALRRRAAPWTISADDWFTDIETLRALVGRLVGDDADGVAFVPATSYGFAVAALNLPVPSGSRIMVLAGEYPSGVYTWRRHAAQFGAEVLTVGREPGQSWTDAVLDGLDERVAIVSVPQVYWTDGAWVDLGAVAARAREVGAALVVDVSQSLGVVPLDVRALDPDFVVSVGYKWLLGPLGRGYLWVAPRHRDGAPLEQNWIVRAGAEDFTRLTDYRDEYQPGARRFDHGQRTQFELTPMAIAAVGQVLAWGVETVAARLAAVTDEIVSRLGAIGLSPSWGERGPHLLGLNLPEDMRSAAVTAMAEARCYASVRSTSLRLAPHLHTSDEDVDRLVDTLRAALP
jgi:selenocysteine lyase/cysteine desulfurase